MKHMHAALQALKTSYTEEIAALRHSFERTGDGTAAIHRRSGIVDKLVQQLWRSHGGRPDFASGVAVAAIGGYGRRQLFPHSDIDVLFLCGNKSVESELREPIRACAQSMWDVGLRASVITRTLPECERSSPENIEFTLSLLDRRFLTGDRELFQALADTSLPGLVQREWRALLLALTGKTRERYARFGGTIFHLEPNVKDGPGGLRDHNLAHWLSLLPYAREERQPLPASTESQLEADDATSAFEFLCDTRCFLHLRANRDDNSLSWGAQDDAAEHSIGLDTTGSTDPAYWMRTYYRHARTISRRALLLAESLPVPSSRYARALRRKPSAIAGTDFVLANGRVDLSDAAAGITDPDSVLRIFGIIAAQGYGLTQRAEEAIASALPLLDLHAPEGPFLWNAVREVLMGRHAAQALRTMHALGVLELLLPEFHGIDALVIRDSYHRYTVDEHTFLAIGNIHALGSATLDWEKRFAALLPELDRLDLLLLAILMHDTGKGRRTGDHTVESVELAEGVLQRLDLDGEEREIVKRLIADHLEMSAALRRDIFDPETIRAFAEKVVSPTHLKRLTLLTYADIRAVNPEALTPWKAESLWQLFISTANFLDRNVDEERFHADIDPARLRRIVASVPGQAEQLRRFVEGLPQRYLETRLPEQIRAHMEMAARLEREPVQVALRKTRQLFELTLIARDRPLFFADVAGVLSAWGMDIVKADAFSNEEGVVVDSFLFADSFQTLELNPSEFGRFSQSVLDVVGQRVSVEKLLRSRRHAAAPAVKFKVDTKLHFDNESSSHSTVLQVVAQDGPGLLRTIASTVASVGCDIRVALIDTEGEMAVDVFYLTVDRAKLPEAMQQQLAASLELAIGTLRPSPALAG